LLAVEDSMKTVVLIIFMRGWSGEAVEVHSVEFNSKAACENAASQLLKKENENPERMKFMTGTYTCVGKDT